MRWFSFTIMLFVALVLQVGMARLFGLGRQRIMPDLLLMLMVILAFRGSHEQAPLAGWILGLIKDLSSESPLGGYAFAFGLTAWVIVRSRELFFGDNPISLMFITFVAGFLAEQFVLTICLFKNIFTGEGYSAISTAIVFSALLTAGLVPYGQWMVMRFHRQLGLPRQRRYGR